MYAIVARSRPTHWLPVAMVNRRSVSTARECCGSAHVVTALRIGFCLAIHGCAATVAADTAPDVSGGTNERRARWA